MENPTNAEEHAAYVSEEQARHEKEQPSEHAIAELAGDVRATLTSAAALVSSWCCTIAVHEQVADLRTKLEALGFTFPDMPQADPE